MVINKSTFFFISLLWLLYLPSFIRVVAGASSMAAGVVLGCFIIIAYFFLVTKKINYFYVKFSVLFYLLFFFAVVHFFISNVIYGSFELKGLLSLLLILTLLVSALFYSNIFHSVNSCKLVSFATKVTYLMMVLILISLVYRPGMLGYSIFEKSMFPFSEPSHFITTLGFVFLFSAFTSKNKYVPIYILSLLFVFSMFMPSSLGLIYICMVLFFLIAKFRTQNALFIYLIVFILVYLILSFSSIDFNYFSSRMTFSTDSTNSTALVFLQGWEDSWNTIVNNPFGLGLQNAALVESGDVGLRIHEVTGKFINKDGAFLASKLIVEFGYLGVFLVILYLPILLHSVIYLYKYSKLNGKVNFSNEDQKKVFCCCIIVSFVVEMFVRGYGYFSPNVLLLLFAITYSFSNSSLLLGIKPGFKELLNP